jgi:hypothetical protein
VVLFGKNAPPPLKSIMQIQPSTAKLTPKPKRSSEAVAPQARAKTRKVLIKKIRKEAAPSSPNLEVPVANQVWITFPFFNIIGLLFMAIFFNCAPSPCSLSLWMSLAGKNPHASRVWL